MNPDTDPPSSATADASERALPGFLQTLVTICHNSGMELPLSMLVGGIWLTGNISSERKFMDHVVKDLTTALQRAEITVTEASLREGAFRHLVEKTQIEEGILPEYVYLKLLSTINGNVQANFPGNIVRIQLSSIDACQLGIMSVAH